jgi:CHAT domain-containing protein
MAMPHEPTFHQAGWQARDVFNIVVSAAEFAREPRARRYLRLLAVLAAPVANARGDGPTEGRSLDVWGEWERLRQATDRARDVVNETGAPWAVVRLVPPTAESLRRALVPRDPGYQVLHLSCHGSPSGLTLEDTLGRERLLPTDDLVAVLRTTTVRLVVLNACSTAELGQALVERAGVPCVIATREPIDDREARLLSEQLYGDLAAGACVGEALKQTQNTIIEQMRAGDLRVPGTPEARANNLLLFGDSGLRLDPGDEAASAPCFILHPVPHNHPLPFEKVSGFVCRADELVELARWFEQTGRRAFLISGVGGIGKTALALNAALRHSYRFRALAFTSAKDLSEFGALQVLQALNEALSITTTPDEAANLPGAIARRLNTNAVLLILDNLETLARERIAELAHALAGLDPLNGSRVLMTLRPLEHDPLTALADRRDRRDLATLGRVDALRLAWDEAGRQELQLTPQSYGRPLAPDQGTELAALRDRAQLPAVLARVEVAALAELGELAFHHPALIKLAVAIVAEEGWDQARHAFQRLRGYGIEQAAGGDDRADARHPVGACARCARRAPRRHGIRRWGRGASPAYGGDRTDCGARRRDTRLSRPGTAPVRACQPINS